jgi:glucose dehydrogenase
MSLSSERFGLWWCWAVGGVTVILGVAIFLGGTWLAALGGSLYYFAAGILLTLSGILFATRRRRGVWLYLFLLAATVLWAVWEVGLSWWELLPRLLAPTVLGIVLAASLPLTRGRPDGAGA